MLNPEPALDLPQICAEVLLFVAARMARLQVGQTLRFTSGDAEAPAKIEAWCADRDYPILASTLLADNRWQFLIEKA
jgi:TusA-related sulfurtransferase